MASDVMLIESILERFGNDLLEIALTTEQSWKRIERRDGLIQGITHIRLNLLVHGHVQMEAKMGIGDVVFGLLSTTHESGDDGPNTSLCFERRYA